MKFKDPSFQGVSGRSDGVPGSFAQYINIDIKSSASKLVSYSLESALIHAPSGEISETGFTGTSKISQGGLRMKTGNKKEGIHLTEWFLNGPEDGFFSRITNRKVTRTYHRERLESKESKRDKIEISPEKEKTEKGFLEKFDSIDTSLETSSKRVDFLKIEANNLKFLVGKVPDGIGPNWSSNVAIEYRKAWGGIPSVSEREEILEVCSFVLGRQLLSIGYTLYDENEDIVEAYGRNPWGRSTRSFCSQPDFPPINIFAIPPSSKAETLIGGLLPKYHEVCELFFFKEALWNLWISRQVPVGTNLPILAAGIESIINGWFYSGGSRSKGLFLERDRFVELLKEDLNNIRQKLEGIPEREKIVDKIMRANEFGIMERYRRFFQEINLSVASEEWDAIKERSKFVHGEELFDKTDWRVVVQRTQALETLFNKIFLKLLEYKGDFINRSITGWPNAQLA
jgi:hypothetical protein